MAFLDKVTSVAKSIGNKAGEVVTTTKLSVKISGEKDSILDNQRKIGEYYYNKLHAGEVDAEVKPFFDAITESFANIDAYEKEKEEQKADKKSAVVSNAEDVATPMQDAQPVTEAQPEAAEEAPEQSEVEPAQPLAEEPTEQETPPPSQEG